MIEKYLAIGLVTVMYGMTFPLSLTGYFDYKDYGKIGDLLVGIFSAISFTLLYLFAIVKLINY